jgi:signal transduction histidine kinase
MKNKITAWFYSSFINISLRQLNMLSLWIILFFTVIFTWLTIQEEYKIFEKNFDKDSQAYFDNRLKELNSEAHRIKGLIELLVSSNETATEDVVSRITEIFNQDDALFITLLDEHDRLISGDAVLSGNDLETLKQQHAVIEKMVILRGVRENAIMKLERLQNGSRIVVGIPTASTADLQAERKMELKRRLIRIILEFATLAFIIFGFILGINKVYNALLERDVESFLDFFKRSARQEAVINPHTIFFAEFKKMVEYANEMVTELASHKRSLETLNLSLEEKVQKKTAALEVKNFDLEQEKAFSQQLVESQKAFIRYAIHETNTPLSVIVANIDLYTMVHGKNKYLSKIDASVKNLFNIYDDLAYLVKKDQVDYPRKRIPLEEVVRSRIEFFTEVAEQAGHEFIFESDCSEFTITFNETKLNRIIDNNLTNAIKYTLQNEPIHITLTRDHENCRFSISSHSQPIEDTGKVFEAFYREKSAQQGFGLGLNLVKSICDEEGVEIDVESDETRTRFTYIFARDDEDTAA